MLLLARGAKNVALKLGRNGVYVAGKGFQPRLVPSFEVETVDTTAAGDVFNAAFAVALVEGQCAGDAARFASAAAAISVTRHGSQASAPSRGEVLCLLASALPGK
jgi:ribokinase